MDQSKGGKYKKSFFQICFVFFLIVHMICLCFWGTKKINFHIDEYFTYALSNKTNATMPAWPQWENGKIYEGDDFFVESLIPKEEERFQYAMVWENQKNDVHPPLYYFLVHTVCSFFPGVFSKWEGLFVNFMLLIVIDILLYQIGKKLFENQWTALLAVAVNALSLIGLNMALYLRMYTLMTVFVLGITLLFITYQKKEKDWKFYVGVFLLAAGGTLSQYYFLIYLFFLCLIYGIILLVQKKWKEAAGFVIALAFAGAASIAVFPPMVRQIFGGSDRGQEAFENARTLPNAIARLKSYYEIINREVFGGFALIFVICALGLLIVGLFRHWKVKEKIGEVLLFFPAVLLYCTVVAVISPYMEDRYVMAVTPLLILTGVWILYYLGSQIWCEKAVLAGSLTAAAAFAVLIGLAMRSAGWAPTYTYRALETKRESLHWYEGCSVIYVTENSWTVNDNMEELKHYKDYVFLNPKEVEVYMKTREDEQLVLYNDSAVADEDILAMVMRANSKLSEAVKVFQDGRETTYYLK